MSALHGFEQTRQRRIDELDAVLHEYTHAASGARLCWLEREDENKSFCAAFRTLPFDDTGVFHILEHSVLCGSKHFPVKEPFVELMKGSLNTFLNALTFPDKTCYPVASRNGRDFLNLMRVYLDAVFFPSIHEKPEIFRQEGWHYELRDGVLTRSGVVLNEMKGAFADADELLISAMSRALFPDSPYRFVSGGDPEAIPTLTYEAFTAAHKRFYHPSNAYLLLDGSVDLSRCLALLNSYLSRFTAIFPDTDIRPQTPVCPPRKTIEYPLPAGEPAETRWKLGQGHVIGTSQDTQTLFAAQVLCDVLCGSNHAPLCRAVLETGLAEDVTLSCDDECLQPMLLLQVQNFRRDDLPAIEQTIRRTLTDLCEQGLDREQIEASLASFEFRLRERDYGTMPRGLVFSLEILSSWLSGGDPAALLGFGPVFEQLRQAIGTGYYEALLRRLDQEEQMPLSIARAEKGHIELEELPLYSASIGTASVCAGQRESGGEGDVCGDASAARRCDGGRLLLMLCDGMGHGREAHELSEKTLELLLLLMEAGYTRRQAITAVNGIMLSQKEQPEGFSTVDLADVDLWTGDVALEKLGACASWLIRGDHVKKLEASSLPLGVMEEARSTSVECRLHSGDILVLLSDGISDVFPDDAQMRKMLEESVYIQPQRMADALIRNAILASGGTPRDDMTAQVLLLMTRGSTP